MSVGACVRAYLYIFVSIEIMRCRPAGDVIVLNEIRKQARVRWAVATISIRVDVWCRQCRVIRRRYEGCQLYTWGCKYKRVFISAHDFYQFQYQWLYWRKLYVHCYWKITPKHIWTAASLCVPRKIHWASTRICKVIIMFSPNLSRYSSRRQVSAWHYPSLTSSAARNSTTQTCCC